MSWVVRSAMDERVCFVGSWLRGGECVSALCARYGVSRKTGYKWLARYKSEGAAGLSDRSSAPLSAALPMSCVLSDPILTLRRARPNWGPRKLLARLAMDHPEQVWPAASTVGDLLAREGMVTRRRRGKRETAPSAALVEPVAANASWSADFKGWFRTGDGVRCEPLTVTDNFSRYLLVSQAVPKPSFAAVKPLFIHAFREHGLPASLRTDNGNPFAARRGLAGLSRFSVWLLKLDIWPDRIAPGRPDQNGRHERMHRTLNQDAATPRSADIATQQARMDAWRVDFNTLRPHEALGNRCPASLYVSSTRAYPETLASWDYPQDHHKRLVNKDGYVQWQDRPLYLSEALIGEEVAICRRDDGDWSVRFRAFNLALLAQDTGLLARNGLATLSPRSPV